MRPITAEPLPSWLVPLAERAASVEPERLSRLKPPAQGGRPSAVLVLIGPGPDVLILERAASLRNHAGQPAFPGGSVDPQDADPVATALREAWEEVGLDPRSVVVITTLPRLWIPVTGFVVTPVLAWWRAPHPVRPVAVAEVARVHRVPVAELADPANRLRIRHPSGYIGPAFQVHGMLVWGFTAGVLSTILDLAGWARPWDSSRIEELPPSQLGIPAADSGAGAGASDAGAKS